MTAGRPAHQRWLMFCLVLWAIALCAQAVAGVLANTITGPPPQDALTRSGFEHYYNLEYDSAVSDFEREFKAHPDDPFAINHLLSAVFYRELYRVGALDTGLYSTNNFLVKKKFSFDPKASAQIRKLTDRALALSGQRLERDPHDVQALYARGLTLGLRAEYLALVDKAWFAALRSAISAQHDHEEVLRLAPGYQDAKTIVGVQNYVAGSLPWTIKTAVSLVGLKGSKKKGIRYLYEAANAGGETSMDARISLALFLRREQRFEDALLVVRSITAAHPRNFLFALEEANILKDAGHGEESVAAYRKVLSLGRQGDVYYHPHLELAAFGLGEALRGQNDFAGAAAAYESVRQSPSADPELVQKANLAAGEMYDLLRKRELAVQKYQAVLAAGTSSTFADVARRHLKEPYRNP